MWNADWRLATPLAGMGVTCRQVGQVTTEDMEALEYF